ncbi:MAG: phenylalanine--tRNA ligase subunit alpha, partial [bacterium]
VKELEEIKVQFLGKKGELAQFMKQLKELSNEKKAEIGKSVNRLKELFQEKIEHRREELKQGEYEHRMQQEWIDITTDPFHTEPGSLHPVTVVQQKLEDAFMAMGFQVLDGPHIETEYYNFEALNIAEHHPARDMQDTFYFEDGHLLRTHTSPIQIRGMERLKPPLRIVGPGKVFRCERTDASHDSCFHQFEGMMIDKDISVAHLIYFMKTMLGEVFDSEVEVRLRPGYFPFVEPGFELDMRCLLCQGAGCKFCKRVGWIELIGCGMVHPNVLRSGNIDPLVYSGFAFGIGIDRLAMMKYDITDIRPLHGGNLNFTRCFTVL